MPLYRVILKKAWQISWRHPFLWFFGLFATLLGGTGGFEIVFARLRDLPYAWTNLSAFKNWLAILFSPQGAENFKNLLSTDQASLYLALFVFGVILAFNLALIFLAVTSQAGLVFSIRQILNKRKINLRQGFQAGKKFFWPVLFINILATLLIWLGLIVAGSLTAQNLGEGTLYAFLLFAVVTVLFFLFNLIVYFASLYAVNYKVLMNASLADSIRLALKLFAGNLLISLEMALILYLVAIAVVVAIVAVAVLLAVPFYLLITLLILFGWQTAIYVVLTLAVLAVGLLVLFASAWLTTFQLSAWTMLFLRLTEGGAVSKIMRLIGAK